MWVFLLHKIMKCQQFGFPAAFKIHGTLEFLIGETGLRLPLLWSKRLFRHLIQWSGDVVITLHVGFADIRRNGIPDGGKIHGDIFIKTGGTYSRRIGWAEFLLFPVKELQISSMHHL